MGAHEYLKSVRELVERLPTEEEWEELGGEERLARGPWLREQMPDFAKDWFQPIGEEL
jgi:formylglycine-generating enzyme required for sulfatase activity